MVVQGLFMLRMESMEHFVRGKVHYEMNFAVFGGSRVSSIQYALRRHDSPQIPSLTSDLTLSNTMLTCDGI